MSRDALPATVLARWQTRALDCADTPAVEDVEHARYLLSSHAGHGGCEQYLTALSYGAVVSQ